MDSQLDPIKGGYKECGGEELVWCPVSGKDPMPNDQAERTVDQQISFDPDIWVVEIEDRKGRHWFPGRVVNL